MTKEEIARQRDAIVKEALSWLNTPFHHCAAIKGAGVDCAQFLREVYKRTLNIEIEFPEFPGFPKGQYPPQWFLHDLENTDKAEFYLHGIANAGCIEISRNQADKGDLILTKIGRVFCHGGILVGGPFVIQAESCPNGANKVTKAHMMASWFLARREMKFFSKKEWHE